jgi:hypothetical protein
MKRLPELSAADRTAAVLFVFHSVVGVFAVAKLEVFDA